MQKSKKGLIFGIIALFFSIILSFISLNVLSLILAVLTAGGTNTILAYITLYLNIFSNLIIFIALFFYSKKAKIGGFIMLLAFICNISVYIVCLFYLNASAEFIPVMFISLIPSVLILISAVLGILSKLRVENISDVDYTPEEPIIK